MPGLSPVSSASAQRYILGIHRSKNHHITIHSFNASVFLCGTRIEIEFGLFLADSYGLAPAVKLVKKAMIIIDHTNLPEINITAKNDCIVEATN